MGSIPKITIAIPSYNNEKHIAQAIESALVQNYPLKEIVVFDDCSTDQTVVKAANYHGVKVSINSKNIGIGKNLERCFNEAKGKYIIFLCADDLFVDKHVVGDVVRIFDNSPDIGIIGRYYYYFMDGKSDCIGTCREHNILVQSCCPSGVSFRNSFTPKGANKIFVEMPTIVSQYLHQYRWTMLEYDTVGARFHPGGNTGTKKSYYTESPTQNWIDLLGQNYQDFPMFVQLKNRAPKLLWKEIWLHVKNEKSCLMKMKFWFYALVAITIPSWILKKLTSWYRSIQRAEIIERKANV